MMYKEVDGCFRYGVTKTTRKKFELAKIEEYDEDYYNELWETCDVSAAVASPGGPATCKVTELVPREVP
jgi:hypothetical protein